MKISNLSENEFDSKIVKCYNKVLERRDCMDNIRIEYLFPTKSYREVTYLDNSPLVSLYEEVIAEKDVYQFTLEEFKKYMVFANYNQTTEKAFQDMYGIWLVGNVRDKLNMKVNCLEWCDEVTKRIAKSLYDNPTQLPFFIISNAVQIIGTFLGVPDLYDYAKSNFSQYFSFPRQNPDKFKYRHENFVAKYSLSIFLSIINHLLALGVNLEELKFIYLQDGHYFKTSVLAGLWNKNIINIQNNLI